ncbi:sulfotransferase [Haloflavibacter putidus]|uniref:Sulfotransferase n=1 Tax=Haloflavibacter putidus TaxID=2576776 RepID=A0A507Z7X8_9FLAO|nr:sulfotransferase [Haloflavibacter putidus]TQD33826.1 sulfotransferase [Haloflavibacter putidus]
MNIIFCAGISVRTGTNYMGSIFSEIPEVASVPKNYSKGEFPFFRKQVIQNYDSWIKGFNRRMFAQPPLNKKKFASFYGESFLNYLKAEYEIKEKTIFVKDPGLYNIERFYDYFPKGKLIILTRSAPDLIASSLKASLQIRKSQSKKKKISAKIKYYSGYNMYTYAKAYKKHATHLRFLREQLKGGFLEVKYENLVNEPNKYICEILDYCEVPYNNEIIQNTVNAKVVGSSYFGSKKHSQEWGALEKTSDFKPVGRYKSWGWFNRFIYNRIAKKSNEFVGYSHNL